MPWPVYMDVHIPAAITSGLRRRRIDVLTSQEDSTTRWPDEQLLERATDLERILFSQDDDLLILANTWQNQSRPFRGVIYAHQQSAGIGRLVLDLELVLSCCSEVELVNSVIYLPLQ